MKVELSKEDLFLIEMAIDETMWHLKESSSIFERYSSLNQVIYQYRRQEEANNDK